MQIAKDRYIYGSSQHASKRPLQISIDYCTSSRIWHSRTAHVLIRLAEFGAIMASRTSLFDNVFDDFLQTPVVILVTRNPWWFPDMQMPRVAEYMVCQIFVGFEAFIYRHMETTKHDGNKP